MSTDNTNNTRNRRTELQILDDRRDTLTKGLITYKQFLEVIPVNKQDQFKKNFLELCTQDYLLSNVNVKELIRFAVNVSKTGLDISPSSKEVYIVPFDTLVNKVKTMLPQAIIPLNGMQQLAYQKGFFLLLDAVWKFDDGSCESESKLTRLQQANLKTANAEWVEAHFIGFDVTLTDLKNELPTQVKFVDLNYVKEATKTMKDERWKLQTWRHKAVRRAYGDFMIPRDRKIEAFEEIESLNDSVLKNADSTSGKLLTLENEKALTQLGVGLQKVNGIAIASNFHGKEKTLQEFGFTKNGGNWSIEYAEDTEVTPTKKTSVNNAAKLLFTHLSKRLSKEQIGSFVSNVLGLTKTDTQGINEVLEDLSLLDKMVEKYLSELPQDGNDAEADNHLFNQNQGH